MTQYNVKMFTTTKNVFTNDITCYDYSVGWMKYFNLQNIFIKQSRYENVYSSKFELVLLTKGIDFAILTRDKAMPELWAIIYG